MKTSIRFLLLVAGAFAWLSHEGQAFAADANAMHALHIEFGHEGHIA